MLQCWEFEPNRRPTFSSIVDVLSQLLEAMVDYMDTSAFASGSTEPTATKVMGDNFRSNDVFATVFKNDP